MQPRKPTATRRRLRAVLLALAALCLTLGGWYIWPPAAAFPEYRLDIHLPSAPGSPLQAGFAALPITPRLGAESVWLAGFSAGRAARGVHDPLEARAMVLDDGSKRVALVVLDLIGFPYSDTIRFRKSMPSELGIDYVALCATHNHQSPDLIGLWGPGLQSGRSEAYADSVRAVALRALSLAVERLSAVELRAGQAASSSDSLLAGNQKGSARALYRGGIRDNRPPLVIDDRVTCVRFVRHDDGETAGSVVIWANHPEAMGSRNTDLTSDFPHALREEAEARLGGTCLFLVGAIGGLMSPLGVELPDAQGQPSSQADFARCEGLGRAVARVACAALAGASALRDERPALRLAARTVFWPLENEGFYAAAKLGLLSRGFVKGQLRTEVGVLGIGPVELLLCPGELYPELFIGGVVAPPGADFPDARPEGPPLTEIMPGSLHAVVGLANDLVGYIIPRSEWDAEAPYLYDSPKAWYGEEMSTGPSAAQAVVDGWQALLELPR